MANIVNNTNNLQQILDSINNYTSSETETCTVTISGQLGLISIITCSQLMNGEVTPQTPAFWDDPTPWDDSENGTIALSSVIKNSPITIISVDYYDGFALEGASFIKTNRETIYGHYGSDYYYIFQPTADNATIEMIF